MFVGTSDIAGRTTSSTPREKTAASFSVEVKLLCCCTGTGAASVERTGMKAMSTVASSAQPTTAVSAIVRFERAERVRPTCNIR
jgi:hypothetical protein